MPRYPLASQTIGAPLIIVVGLLALSSCAIVEPATPGQFYEPDNELLTSSEPGKILRAEPLPSAPEGASAYRVLYRSSSMHDKPIAVSGIIVVPDSTAPQEDRPIVAWAHGTTGVASRCALSLNNHFSHRIPGLQEMLDRGYVVAITDYPGLGTPEPHPYLVGISEAHGILDIVRATGRFPEAGAGNTFVVWGHSQGGHAALFTGQLAASYAPELNLVGVAAAAPATDLATLLREDLASAAGKILSAYALSSWNRVYDAPLDSILVPTAKPAVEEIADLCIESHLQGLAVLLEEQTLNQQFLDGDLAEVEPWKSLLARNTPGNAPAGAPVFLAQGTGDEIVDPEVTTRYAETLCNSETPVRYEQFDGATHIQVKTQSAPSTIEWIAARFAGEDLPSHCDMPASEPEEN